MARDAGARRVYFASAAPPVRFPNVYGIDMPAADELIAHGCDEAQVAQAIGADKLIYQNLVDLEHAVRKRNPALTRFDTSVFTGEYVTNDITPEYLNLISMRRADAAKTRRLDPAYTAAAIDLHNVV
jgi:amidophosphoribosyltransferase